MLDDSMLTIGKTCYHLVYHDENCCIPKITTYIYAGKGSSSIGEDKWCFQNPLTYMVYGILKEYPKELYGVKNFDFDSRFLNIFCDLNGLINKLSALGAQRKEATGFVPGKIYFFVEYYDLELTMPIFDTWIYIGKTEHAASTDADKTLHLFREPGDVQNLPENPTVVDSDLSADTKSLNRFYDLPQLTDLLIKLRDRIG